MENVSNRELLTANDGHAVMQTTGARMRDVCACRRRHIVRHLDCRVASSEAAVCSWRPSIPSTHTGHLLRWNKFTSWDPFRVHSTCCTVLV